jgi:hypothetical protein
MKRNIDLVMVVAAAALVPACVAFDTETVAPETGTVSSALDDGCVGVNCPGNSDLFAALGIFELSLDPSKANVRGFSLDPSNIWQGGTQLGPFQVNGATVRAWKVIGALAGWESGGNLIGTTIRVRHRPSNTDYDLRIDNYIPAYYYTNPLPADLPPFDAFEIRYAVAGSDYWQDLCPYTTYPDPFDNAIQGTWAVFWKGDRLDPQTGIFTAHDTDVGDWFNISCAGEATIKMLRTGTGGAVDPSTTRQQRQATLDMFTARYCPGPERYTKLGTKIDWNDKTGSNILPSSTTIYEAIWNGNGAVCLNTPRIKGQTYTCEPPPCTAYMLDHWRDYGDLRSAPPQ